MESASVSLASNSTFFDNLKVLEVGIAPLFSTLNRSDGQPEIGFIAFLTRTRLQRLTLTTYEVLYLIFDDFNTKLNEQHQMLARTVCPVLKGFKIFDPFWRDPNGGIVAFLSAHKATLDRVGLSETSMLDLECEVSSTCNALLKLNHLSHLRVADDTFESGSPDLYKRFNTLWTQNLSDENHPQEPIVFDQELKARCVLGPVIPHFLRFIQSEVADWRQ